MVICLWRDLISGGSDGKDFWRETFSVDVSPFLMRDDRDVHDGRMHPHCQSSSTQVKTLIVELMHATYNFIIVYSLSFVRGIQSFQR